MSEAWDNIALKFKSANNIPVERATVTRGEFLAIEKERKMALDAMIHMVKLGYVCDSMEIAIEYMTGLPVRSYCDD